MLNRMLGTKVGMTQIFDEKGDALPVTVVDLNNWVVTQIKSSEKDGYSALQLGLMRKRFRGLPFSSDWLKEKNDYFLHIKEVMLENTQNFTLGQLIGFDSIALQEGDTISASGTSKGRGFQGVVKRWGFSGGPASHGSKFHRIPGSSGHLRRQGEVIKGKKFPGHAGAVRITVKGLEIVRIDRDAGCLFIKGAIPGKKDFLVAINKQGS